jgi:cell division septum initiation protein DivIVA
MTNVINYIKNLIPFFKQNEQLKKEVEELKEKLSNSQKVINKTNAYWKKKLHQKGRSS